MQQITKAAKIGQVLLGVALVTLEIVDLVKGGIKPFVAEPDAQCQPNDCQAGVVEKGLYELWVLNYFAFVSFYGSHDISPLRVSKFCYF